jgi:hypothetical protein
MLAEAFLQSTESTLKLFSQMGMKWVMLSVSPTPKFHETNKPRDNVRGLIGLPYNHQSPNV